MEAMKLKGQTCAMGETIKTNGSNCAHSAMMHHRPYTSKEKMHSELNL